MQEHGALCCNPLPHFFPGWLLPSSTGTSRSAFQGRVLGREGLWNTPPPHTHTHTHTLETRSARLYLIATLYLFHHTWHNLKFSDLPLVTSFLTPVPTGYPAVRTGTEPFYSLLSPAGGWCLVHSWSSVPLCRIMLDEALDDGPEVSQGAAFSVLSLGWPYSTFW